MISFLAVPRHKLFVLLGFLSLFIYGFLLEPTPESFSLYMFVFAGIAAIPYLQCLAAITYFPGYGVLIGSAFMVGLARAIVNVNGTVDIIRDTIGLGFWILGPLLVFYLAERSKDILAVSLAIGFVGVMFSIRHILEADEGLTRFVSGNINDNLKYLSSEPSVFYGAILFLRLAFKDYKTIIRVLYLCLSILALLGLVASTYRGPLALYVFYFGFCILFASVRIKLLSLPIVVGMIAYLFQYIVLIYDKVMSKFDAVGANSKNREFIEIFFRDNGLWDTLFGAGLGGTVELVGAGHNVVRYTHNAFTYISMKFGDLVLFGFVVYFFVLLVKISLSRKDVLPEVIVLSYTALFQAGYKLFGFSLVLGILMLKLKENEVSKNNKYRGEA